MPHIRAALWAAPRPPSPRRTRSTRGRRARRSAPCTRRRGRARTAALHGRRRGRRRRSSACPLSPRPRSSLVPSAPKDVSVRKSSSTHERAAAQHLDSFLRHRRGTETRVVDRRHRAVSVLNRDRRALGRRDARTTAGRRLRGRARGVPHSQLAKSKRWHASPRMRPPPSSGSFSQCSGRDGRVHAVDELERAGQRVDLLGERRGRAGANGRLKPIASRSFSRAGLPDLVDLLPGQAERLLDEDGFAGAQRRGGDLGMRVVPGADDDEIDVRRLDGLAPVGARPRAVRASGRATSADDPPRLTTVVTRTPSSRWRFGTWVAAHEAAGSDERDAHLAVRAARVCAERARNSSRARSRPVRIGEHGRRRRRVARERLVRLGRAIDRKLELDERIERDEPVGDEPQVLLHVAARGPANVRQRIVEPALLVRRVVAARAVRGGDQDVGLALVQRLAVEVEADVADGNDLALAPQHAHGLVDEVAALRRGRDHDCVGSGAVRPGRGLPRPPRSGLSDALGAELATPARGASPAARPRPRGSRPPEAPAP